MALPTQSQSAFSVAQMMLRPGMDPSTGSAMAPLVPVMLDPRIGKPLPQQGVQSTLQQVVEEWRNVEATADKVHFELGVKMPWEVNPDLSKLFDTETDKLRMKINILRGMLGYKPLSEARNMEKVPHMGAGRKFVILGQQPHFLDLDPRDGNANPVVSFFDNKDERIKELMTQDLVRLEVELITSEMESSYPKEMRDFALGIAAPHDYEQCPWVPDQLKKRDPVSFKRWSREGPTPEEHRARNLLDRQPQFVHSSVVRSKEIETNMKNMFLAKLRRTQPRTNEELALFYKYVVRRHEFTPYYIAKGSELQEAPVDQGAEEDRDETREKEEEEGSVYETPKGEEPYDHILSYRQFINDRLNAIDDTFGEPADDHNQRIMGEHDAMTDRLDKIVKTLVDIDKAKKESREKREKAEKEAEKRMLEAIAKGHEVKMDINVQTSPGTQAAVQNLQHTLVPKPVEPTAVAAPISNPAPPAPAAAAVPAADNEVIDQAQTIAEIAKAIGPTEAAVVAADLEAEPAAAESAGAREARQMAAQEMRAAIAQEEAQRQRIAEMDLLAEEQVKLGEAMEERRLHRGLIARAAGGLAGFLGMGNAAAKAEARLRPADESGMTLGDVPVNQPLREQHRAAVPAPPLREEQIKRLNLTDTRNQVAAYRITNNPAELRTPFAKLMNKFGGHDSAQKKTATAILNIMRGFARDEITLAEIAEMHEGENLPHKYFPD